MNVSEWIQTIFLALVQGISEFLPISSSAHLILPAQLWGWEDQGLAFDVGVHLGTLVAVVVYFRQDILSLFKAWLLSLKGVSSTEGLLSWLVILGTLPAVIAGGLFVSAIEHWGRSILIIAATTIIFGALMGLADLYRTERRALAEIKMKDAIWIGLAQAMSLIPGTSRSGSTITAALLLGFDRQSAARFSFLLSIPVTFGACVMMMARVQSGASVLPLEMLFLGALVAGVSAWCCIHLFLKWIASIGMMPFVIYRMVLGAVLLLVYFFGSGS
ncbi:undecaprenyl-diphosphate phosphatase [Nitrincola nitratireducens]|uniref:Undecaprenyl-diphosphatase n=1 Tax=Nitrincola nitratireducens TaxID=1229521 RepID=W9UX04_9GAMM|nr:undecaprenyl-diphosphate phosphatase [Nitrincola nitratireducens]EXJ11609.1 Undecaprenyl-diphosphatase [Nitrincola nitratireducens]